MLDKKLIKKYLGYMENVRLKSLNTVNNYNVDLNLLFKFLDKETNVKTIHDVTLDELHSFIEYCGERGDAISTRARRIASMKSFFKYLKGKAKVISENPAEELETLKIPNRTRNYLNLEQSQRLLSVVDGRHKERDYAIITIFLNCGLRLSELVGIDIKHIKGNRLNVIGKGNKERVIFLNQTTIDAIAEYLTIRPKSKSDALFVSQQKKRISVSAVQNLIKKHMEKAELDTSVLNTHSLRHSAATLMYKHGNVDIRTLQDILGHSSLSTTQIYTHVDEEELQNAMNSNPLNA